MLIALAKPIFLWTSFTIYRSVYRITHKHIYKETPSNSMQMAWIHEYILFIYSIDCDSMLSLRSITTPSDRHQIVFVCVRALLYFHFYYYAFISRCCLFSQIIISHQSSFRFRFCALVECIGWAMPWMKSLGGIDWCYLAFCKIHNGFLWSTR